MGIGGPGTEKRLLAGSQPLSGLDPPPPWGWGASALRKALAPFQLAPVENGQAGEKNTRGIRLLQLNQRSSGAQPRMAAKGREKWGRKDRT